MAQFTKGGVYNRRRKAVNRLQQQLAAGTKPNPEDKNGVVELTQDDIARIHKEIGILQKRI